MAESKTSLLPVYATAGFFSLIWACYAAARRQPSPMIELGMSLGMFVAVFVWLRRDARAHGVRLVYDWGFIALALWPLLLPWYAFRTRGWGGVGLLARLIGTVLLPALVGAILSALRAPAHG